MSQHSEYLGASWSLSGNASRAPSKSGWNPHRLITAAVILLVGVPLATMGRFIWIEWQALRDEETRVSDTAVIGYPNIYPLVSRAAKPDPWFRVEGDAVFVWSGWRNGQGHSWFQAHLGDCDKASLGEPVGRDVSQAIDYPVVETGGGRIWERIPENAAIVGVALGNNPCAYPMTVLDKVLIVNDVIDDRPYLVHLDPYGTSATPVSIFDSRLEGHRITLGSSGFSFHGKHVLYDRGTESLWIDEGDGLTAFAGKHKGKQLELVRRVSVMNWGDWHESNPDSRLLIGSLDRRRGMPRE